jgi:uncharacterized protein YunC (DUF1805 family)
MNVRGASVNEHKGNSVEQKLQVVKYKVGKLPFLALPGKKKLGYAVCLSINPATEPSIFAACVLVRNQQCEFVSEKWIS